MTADFPVVALDMDGVLVDFQSKVLGTINETLGTAYTVDDVWAYDYRRCLSKEANRIAWSVIQDPVLYDDLDPEPGAMEAVAALRDLARVVVISSPTDGHAGSKLRWLARHGFDHRDIILAWDKSLAGMGASILVEDKLQTALGWGGPGKKDRKSILFSRPWNNPRPGWLHLVRSWTEIPDLVRYVLTKQGWTV